MTGVIGIIAGGGFSVTVTPASVSGVGTQTGIATATVSGGSSPYTYLWTVEGDALTPDAPTFASTRFVGSPPGAETFIVSAVCTVTDAGGRVAVSNTISAELTGL